MANALIEKIEVKELFGQFSYSIPERGKLNNLSILYGDNGIGKSTILRAVFHMLSPHGNSGHRTALRKIPFSKLIISVQGGFTFSATRPTGPYSETIEFDSFVNGEHTSKWIYSDETTSRSSDDISNLISRIRDHLSSELKNDTSYCDPNINPLLKQGKTYYLSELNSKAPKIYLVGAEREIQKNDSSDSFREFEISQLFIDSRTKKIEDISKTSRNISLNEALSNANKWINNRAIQSANRGSMNVHSVYVHVLKQLSIESSAQNDQ
jgi:AAA15 family ATPase/GTPase